MSRRAAKTGKWRISKHAFYAAMHYAYEYNEWKDEYNALADTSRAITYDSVSHGSGSVDPTEKAAVRREELRQKMEIIEQTAVEADEELYQYILKAVTNEGITYEYLRSFMKIPCGKDMYYDRRRKFYFLLSKKI